MVTKKITLNELRQMVRGIIAENSNIKEEHLIGEVTPPVKAAEYYGIVWVGKEGYNLEAPGTKGGRYYYLEHAIKDAINWAKENNDKALVELIGLDANENDVDRMKVFEIDYKKINKAEAKISSTLKNSENN